MTDLSFSPRIASMDIILDLVSKHSDPSKTSYLLKFCSYIINYLNNKKDPRNNTAIN